MLYDASRVGNASETLFEPACWRARGALTPVAGGRGAAYFLEEPGRSWVLRHYRRGGWMARFTLDRYLWRGEDSTRPFREWRLLWELHGAGLPVPAPIAARYVRAGLHYTGDIITERLAQVRPLAAYLRERELAPARWREVGRCVRRFHAVGVDHADLNAHNVLLGAAEVFLIDFDRGRRRSPGTWANKNLARLHHSLTKIARQLPAGRFTPAHWAALRQGYEGPRP